MLDMIDLGEQIATHRKARGLTQAVLAGRAGVSRSTLASLEKGHTGELGLVKVLRIMAVLGLDLRITTANARRPTLEDLQAEPEDAP